VTRLVHGVRFRLTVWYAASLSVVLLALAALLYGVVHYQLSRHHDGALRDVAAAVSRVLSEQEDCVHLTESQRSRLDQIGHTVLFHEVSGEGRVFYRSPDSAGLTAAIDKQGGDPLSSTAGWFETLPAARGTLRQYSLPYLSLAGRRGLIHVVHEIGDIDQPLASVRLALLVAAPLAVLLSALGGYWLAGRALAPVDQVTRMAREIEAGSLSRRLPAPRADDEIGRLVGTLNQMIARLESSFEAMKRFTADASHELRSPLANMRGAIDVVLGRPREEEEYRRVLSSLGEDVDRLRSIVEDLLVLARADAGRIRLERAPLRLDVLAAEVVESFVPAASARGVSISAEQGPPVLVIGDERWLRQLVANLVGNAVKFSSAGAAAQTPAAVVVEVATAGGEASLRVADTGPGIPEEAFGHIFERFYRADAARAYQGVDGCGLGLAIAAWIAEAQGGKIAARNRPEGGSVFSVTFPLA
jgi:two-component system OmpR family sensor kinase